MTRGKDISGKKFGKLTAIRFIELKKINNKRYYYWLFKCDCGNNVILRKDSVIYKIKRNNIVHASNTTSCGKGDCINGFKHGMINTRFYTIFNGMKNRCLNKKNKNYKNYGGRGITVCDRWKNSFENFRDDMYESYLKHVKEFGEEKTTIDRIDNNDNYCLENCEWKNQKEQSNNKRNNILLEYNGKKLTLSQWSKKLNFCYSTLLERINRYKWSITKALSTPTRIKRNNHFLTFNKETLLVDDWAKKINISKKQLIFRLYKLNWSLKKALTVYNKNETLHEKFNDEYSSDKCLLK